MILASLATRLLSSAISLSFNASLAIIIVDTGVLNSWVILLIKSIFISAIFFCLRIEKMVYPKHTIKTNSSAPDVAIPAVILANISEFFWGKDILILPGSLITSLLNIDTW